MKRSRTPALAVVMAGLALALLALSGCNSNGAEPADTGAAQGVPSQVVVAMFRYAPAMVRVAAGETVTWTNRDQILHTVTAGTPIAPSSRFDGQMDGQGTSFSFQFLEAGTFPFFCARHNAMVGEVEVMPR